MLQPYQKSTFILNTIHQNSLLKLGQEVLHLVVNNWIYRYNVLTLTYSHI